MKEKCRPCQSKNLKIFLKRKKRNLVECQNCGLVFVSPLPTAADLKKIYSQEYFLKMEPGDETKAGFGHYLEEEGLKREYFRKKLNQIGKQKNKGRLLDVGCATGVFLKLAQESGWETWGVDISQFAVNLCRRRGLKNVLKCAFEKMKFDQGFFDVVVAFDLIEHVLDPLKFLKKIGKIMKPNGLLFLTTPNKDSLLAKFLGKKWFGYHHWQHIYFFNPKTLSFCLAKANVFDEAELGVDDPQEYPLGNMVERIPFYYPNSFTKVAAGFLSPFLKVGKFTLKLPLGNIYLMARRKKIDG